MADAFADPSQVNGYHAHIYTRRRPARPPSACAPGSASASRPGWEAGMTSRSDRTIAISGRPRGGQPGLGPWLMLNRQGLDVLVHPLTDDSVADHTRFALWLGTALPLRLDVLRRGPR